MFAHQASTGSVDVAFTDRHGGTSTGSFGSLNLASRSADDAARVDANLARVQGAFAGSRPVRRTVLMDQVHGADVAEVDQAFLDAGDADRAPTADGLVTALAGVVLVVRVADCVPVILADDRAGVVAAAHAGRPGLAAGVVPRTVEVMRTQGASRIRAWVGPHVCGACYEVPADLRAEVAALVPAAHAETSWGTPALDLGAGVLAQLAEAGLDPDRDVERVRRCTLEDGDLFSYRRQGTDSGRLAGLVWRRP